MENAAFLPVAFEVIQLAGALILLLVAVVFGRGRKYWAPIAGLTFLLSAGVGVLQWRSPSEHSPECLQVPGSSRSAQASAKRPCWILDLPVDRLQEPHPAVCRRLDKEEVRRRHPARA